MSDTPSRPPANFSRPFRVTLSVLFLAGVALAAAAPRAQTATAADAFPLTAALTPEMIDYFALSDAFVRPSIADLVTCSRTPACASTDTSRLRILGALGTPVDAYDGDPATIIEQVRSRRTNPADGVTETRVLMRRYLKDGQGRIVVNGSDSIVRRDVGGAGRAPSTLTRVHRYNDLRYLVNDPTLVWPLTGLVVVELSHAVGPVQPTPLRMAAHAAVSFDGTRYAQILTTGALTHRVDLIAKRLETTMPER